MGSRLTTIYYFGIEIINHVLKSYEIMVLRCSAHAEPCATYINNMIISSGVAYESVVKEYLFSLLYLLSMYNMLCSCRRSMDRKNNKAECECVSDI